MLDAVLMVLVALLALSTVLLASYVVRVRGEKHGRGILRKWPVPEVNLHEFDQRFNPGALGPDRRTEIAFIARYHVQSGASDFETWILANLAKTAKTIFEFGTASGKTTYVLARNAPADTRIVTLTLGPDQHGDYQEAEGDEPDAAKWAMQESRFERFYYSGTDVEPKIEQLFGDSKTFDESPYAGQCDLIFIDGSHAYSYVQSDTRKALRMVKPGGVILWHDYRGPRHNKGVFRALNELNRDLALERIKGTWLIAYRQPW